MNHWRVCHALCSMCAFVQDKDEHFQPQKLLWEEPYIWKVLCCRSQFSLSWFHVFIVINLCWVDCLGRIRSSFIPLAVRCWSLWLVCAELQATVAWDDQLIEVIPEEPADHIWMNLGWTVLLRGVLRQWKQGLTLVENGSCFGLFLLIQHHKC